MKKKQPYCDLDGVLADLEGAIRETFPDFIDTPDNNGVKSEMWEKLFLEQGEHLFADLKPYPNYYDLVRTLDKIGPWILLSALPNPNRGFTKEALFGKMDWVDKYLDGQPAIYCLRSHKRFYAKNSVLVDDNYENIDEWVKHGGIGILHKDYSSTIKELKAIYNL